VKGLCVWVCGLRRAKWRRDEVLASSCLFVLALFPTHKCSRKCALCQLTILSFSSSLSTGAGGSSSSMATLRHVAAGLALSLLLLVDVQAFLLPSARPPTTRGKQSISCGGQCAALTLSPSMLYGKAPLCLTVVSNPLSPPGTRSVVPVRTRPSSTITAATTMPNVLAYGNEEEEDVEVAWFEALQAYGGDAKPYDPLLKILSGVSSWKQFQTKVENDWVIARVESDGDRGRLSFKLEEYLDALREYMYVHTLFTDVLAPTANGCDGMFLERVRMEAFESAQTAIRSKQEEYFAAHVTFWADLAAVLRSQEDIPLGEVAKLDQASPLPAPYGQGESGLVLLPMPSLLEWTRDEVGGGVEEQVGALLLFKSVVVPALERVKKEKSREALMGYASMWGRLWRKAGRWFGSDAESVGFLEELYRGTGGRVETNDDVARTGISLMGVGRVERGGMEDAWLQK